MDCHLYVEIEKIKTQMGMMVLLNIIITPKKVSHFTFFLFVHWAISATAGIAQPVEKDPYGFGDEINAFRIADSLSMPPRGGYLFVGSSTIRLWPNMKNHFSGWQILLYQPLINCRNSWNEYGSFWRLRGYYHRMPRILRTLPARFVFETRIEV
jgi:hypothetical protein